jgi:peptidoglycan glycosyltransferase
VNKALRRTGLTIIVLVLLLLANVTYVQVVRAPGLRDNQHNRLTTLANYSRQRGLIVDSTGNVVLAKDVATSGELKYRRKYPEGAEYAPITGYYSLIYGKSEIEHAENDVLNGTDSTLFSSRVTGFFTGKQPQGGNVQLTIVPRVQDALYSMMKAKHYKGAAIAIQPKTGAILGMVSTPSYDPNPLAAHSSKTQKQAWKTYTSNPVDYTVDPDKPLLNRAIQERNPPGSTFKLIDSAAALSTGYSETSKLPADPVITLPHTEATLTNYDSEVCPDSTNGKVTMKTALAYSCNTAFATLTGKLGQKTLREYAQKFGIGQSDLRVPMKVAESTLGKIPSEAALYQTGIGQRNVQLTPLQDAMITATIANDGVRMKPQMVTKILSSTLSTVRDVSPKKLNRAVSPQVANEITDMMIASEKHTVGGGKRPGITIASKTGTAEVGSKSDPPVGWYTAFAPVKNPKIAVAVMVDHGGHQGTSAVGATTSAGTGRAAINAYLRPNG